MKHLGDITKLSGYVVPAVDVVIGGSPCQGLSVAGKQAGLKDERSGLFIEQIRLVKEMRKADAARGKTNDAIRPRYMVWENVPGAFSSNKGRDFEAVLEETVRVAEPKAPPVPVPAKGWPTSGCLMGDGWSVAWRVLDAQFWGTPDKPLPQRRRRISLVADFGGRRSHEILFKPRTMQSLPALGGDRGLPAACGDRGSFIEAGRRVPITRPFQCFRMRASAKERTETAFRNSFGLPTDPFPTLLAGGISPFAFWYEDDPAGGCVRFPTETECERLMGLPEGWTKYGADGEEILSSHRYRALGNAIALPCAEYIMAGIAEALTKGGANDGI